MRAQLSLSLVAAASILSAYASPVAELERRACAGVTTWTPDRIWASGPIEDYFGGIYYETKYAITNALPCPKDKITPVTFTVVDLATCQGITQTSGARQQEISIYDETLQKAYNSGITQQPKPLVVNCYPGAAVFADVIIDGASPPPATPTTGYTIVFG
ncbi:hypothetical protein BOTBODRAFT_177741 [Botryobasidium botryosum FD-172 SS1]|uniref:Uncharacterized protein n=1 Tax=Botryobasidium botryosum (strain FD-172 SS1) TaxID=930990 RepID=A0A067M5P5_BOTB1|nr:hypothetical protein BOTBODRAFT_177741 [Botryobasidium botryosum FD-172 SS1]